MVRIFMVGMSTDKGGVEAYIQNLCSCLTEEYEVIFRLPEMIIDGKKWVCPPNRHNYLKYCSFWRRFFKKNRFDVLYYNTCDIVSIDLLRFAKKAGIPVRIIHSHNTGNQENRGVLHRYAEKMNRKKLSLYATDMFACSKQAGEWMFKSKKFLVIKNGIDLNKYAFSERARAEMRGNLGLADEPVIGCVGRLDPQKNPLFTVEIAKEICRLNPKAHIVMIGDGELREQVLNAISKYKLEDCVHLLGARDDVYKWYSAFDCLVMPSFFEGLPFVLVEAQASGLPCVVSSAVSEEANIADTIEYISLEKSSHDWAEAVLENCRKSRIDSAQKLVDAGYSIQNTANEVMGIINTELGEKV